MTVVFDAAAVFDDDYLYFYEPLLSEERSDAEAELIWTLAGVQPGDRVLDLASGHGRLSNRLAARGADVVGFDVTPSFLDRARKDAAAAGLDVEYVQGDMRKLPWTAEFDVVVNWFTAFGYFDDDTDRAILAGVNHALRPHGRFLLEMNHGANLMRRFLPAITHRVGNDTVFDEHTYDPITGRVGTRRTVLRDGRVRTFEFSVRVFAFPELRDWLHAAGFSTVEGFDGSGADLSDVSARMIVRATKA